MTTRFWVGVTDNAWYEFLAGLKPDEVNFWQPGAGQPFSALGPNELFLFKLHSPLNWIAGGAFFVRYHRLPVSLAWDVFREQNGVRSLDELRRKVNEYSERSRLAPDPEIGCIVLAQPFFWPRDEWLPAPEDWAPNIVRGKRYDTASPVGARLWREVMERLAVRSPEWVASGKETSSPYDLVRLAPVRPGQGAFRVAVTEAYRRRCAITGEKVLPVLEAAHIKPYALAGPNDVNNGLLLRQDIHTLFDRGYLTVTPDRRVWVSRRVREQFGNGEYYYSLHGRELLTVPERPEERPLAEYLTWHNENVFAG
ncbi:MAG: HNH endonuclease [Clostridia bacterium]|nr:HNH endonuclease [Clostridia bacterium]